MPLFEVLATACAPAVALQLLAGIAAIESEAQVLVVRDGPKVERVRSPGEGVAIVVAAIDQGREPAIGLLGVSEKQARKAGFSIADAFDPCANFRIAEAAFKEERGKAEHAGSSPEVRDRLAVRSWWRTDGRYVSGASYEAAVHAASGRLNQLLKTEIPARVPDVVRDAGAVSVSGPPGGVAASEPQLKHIERSVRQAAVPPAPHAPPPAWDVFGQARSSGALIYQRRD
jgi:type IV secretion system protein VirB1